MKKILYLIITILICISSFGQEKINKEEIVLMADEMPTFPGGESEMMKFLRNNLKYPKKEKEANISGKCYVTFVVEKDGSLNNIKILKGVHEGPGFDQEALRVIKLMPRWFPGKENGQIVRVQFNLPIKFTLHTNDSLYLTDTIYYATDWTISSKINAMFYRTISDHDGKYMVKDHYMKNNNPQMIAICSSIEPLEKNGLCTLYYENGQKESEGNFFKKKPTEGLINWQNGDEKNENKYRHGKEGNWIYWYENGQKRKQGNYTNSEQEGSWIEWYENGQKESEGKYISDKEDGRWIFWDKDGEDSTIVQCFPDGTYKNIYLSSKQQTINNKYDVSYPIYVGAEFPGGEREMAMFIKRNITYPKAEKDGKITGICYITFTVERDGILSEIRVLKGIPNGDGYSKETIRIVGLMPKWKPGMRYGNNVRVQYNLPVRFTL